MAKKSVDVISVAVTTFIPWLIILAALGASLHLPRLAFVGLHYTLDIFLFGTAFAFYYKGRPHANIFTTTMIALGTLLFYDVIYFAFMYEGEYWFFSYWDWFVPLFLITSVIYGVGKLFK